LKRVTVLGAVSVITGMTAAAALGQAAPDALQVSGRAQSIDVAARTAGPTAEAPTQISTEADSRPTAMQLTSARGSLQPTNQLSSASRTAEPPPSLSHPADGRTTAVERVTGADACDPEAAKASRSDLCANVIESRAEEYAREQPPELSPEQRLLIDQQWGPGAADVAETARRLARAGVPDGSTDSLGIAATVLQPPQSAGGEDDKSNNAAGNPMVQAIIQMMTEAPPTSR
jgi:hypothetical protein